MLKSVYKLYNLYPSEKSIRLLSPIEKENILQYFIETNGILYNINVDDIICSELGAQINDIICIRNNTTDVYRRVT